MKKPLILIIENSIDVTGALKSITRTAYDLRDYYEFQFVVPRKAKGSFWIEGKGITSIYEFPMKEMNRRLSSLLVYLPYLLSNAIKLNKLTKRNAVSLIHVNDLYNLLPVVLKWLGSDIPYVCHIRFLPDRFPSWLFNFWLKLHLHYAERVVAVSDSVLKQLKPHPKLALIYNELPVEERFPEGIDHNPAETGFTFLYLANFINGKGQNYALEAFARLHQQLPNWKLKFVGGDMGLKKNMEFETQLKERAKVLGVFDRIEWSGFTEAVELEYRRADIVLNFSESESFSITCLEALYFARPVIATDCGGPAEIIVNRVSGILVGNRNVEEMAKAMLELANNIQLRNELATRAADMVRQKFSVENTSFKFKHMYSQILEGNVK